MKKVYDVNILKMNIFLKEEIKMAISYDCLWNILNEKTF